MFIESDSEIRLRSGRNLNNIFFHFFLNKINYHVLLPSILNLTGTPQDHRQGYFLCENTMVSQDIKRKQGCRESYFAIYFNTDKIFLIKK